MMVNWSGKRVLILGAARQGLALARWLSIHGAQVTLSDSRSADDATVDDAGDRKAPATGEDECAQVRATTTFALVSGNGSSGRDGFRVLRIGEIAVDPVPQPSRARDRA